MVVLQIVALAVGIESAVIGFSETAFYRLNLKNPVAGHVLFQLEVQGELTDRKAIRELLYFAEAELQSGRNYRGYEERGLNEKMERSRQARGKGWAD